MMSVKEKVKCKETFGNKSHIYSKLVIEVKYLNHNCWKWKEVKKKEGKYISWSSIEEDN